MNQFYCVVHKKMEDVTEQFGSINIIYDSKIPQIVLGNYGICYASAKDILGKDTKEVKDVDIIEIIEKEKVKKIKEIK